MVLDLFLEEVVEKSESLLQMTVEAGEPVEPSHRGKKIGGTERGQELGRLPQLVVELAPPALAVLRTAPAESLPANNVVEEAEGHIADVGLLIPGAGLGDGLNEDANLLLSDCPKGLDPLRGVQLEHTDLAELAPPLAVGGEGNAVATVGETLGDGGGGPTAEDCIVGPIDLFGHGGVGDNEGWDAAKLQVHERPILISQAEERAVGGLSELMEIPNER